jgi:HAD superfamily hydrolase (TIGR01509 family)
VNVGVLFDVDGTLVDTSYLHTVCWWQALRQLDIDVLMAHVHRAIGMGSDQILDHLLKASEDDRKKLDDEDQLALHTAKKTLYSTYWDRLRSLPGAPELLRACAQAGLAVVLASSASKSELEKLRAALACDDVLTAATSSADAQASKPAPDILEAALDQSGLDARDVVFVGDSVWDVEAAGKLKIPCIGLASGGLAVDELRRAGAVETYASPRDLLDHLTDSPALKPLLERVQSFG